MRQFDSLNLNLLVCSGWRQIKFVINYFFVDKIAAPVGRAP